MYGRPYLRGDATSQARARRLTLILLESAFSLGKSHTFFGRAERVDKNELFQTGMSLADQNFKINKASLGYVYDFPTDGHYSFGIGGVVSRYAIPSALEFRLRQ